MTNTLLTEGRGNESFVVLCLLFHLFLFPLTSQWASVSDNSEGADAEVTYRGEGKGKGGERVRDVRVCVLKGEIRGHDGSGKTVTKV